MVKKSVASELLVVLQSAKCGKKSAGERLELSVRQVQRLVQKYRERGPEGLVSKKRGKVGIERYRRN